jgi:hypothetical protein
MGGWFVDIIVGYLLRTAFRVAKANGSQSWPVENATVTFSNSSFGYGGPVAQVGYTYRHQGRFFSGGHDIPFIFADSAKRYISSLTKGSHIIVRVKPGHPEISIVREGDQVGTAI